MISLNSDQVTNVLPHRPPFLFIDELLSLDCESNKEYHTYKDLIGVSSRCLFQVKSDLEILKGHFPGNPLLPGVIQIEMMAQASAFLFLGLTDVTFETHDFETILVSVQDAKFRRKLSIGDRLEITAKMMKVRGPIGQYQCSIYDQDKKLVSEASLMAQVIIKEKGR